jgi:hypothetical protein
MYTNIKDINNLYYQVVFYSEGCETLTDSRVPNDFSRNLTENI